MKKIILIAVLSVFTISAFAQFDLGKNYEIQNATGYALDVAGAKTDAGTNVATWTSNRGPAQIWRLIKAEGEDTYYILNPNSGKFLDIQGGNIQRGINLHIWHTNCSKAQKFIITSAGDGYYYISTIEGDLYVAPQYAEVKAGTNIVLWDKSDKAKWLFNAW